MADARPDLTLVYVPHLDYDLQRFGPSVAAGRRGRRRARRGARPAAGRRRGRGTRPWWCSRSTASPTSPARSTSTGCCAPRGCCGCYTQAGMEYLDPWTSRAFAVADHQVAHVYVARPGRRAGGGEALRRAARRGRGARRRRARRAHGLDHPRAGELVLVAEPDAWFTYYYWLDDAPRPGLRPARRDPPQARLRPGRAVLRPGRARARPSAAPGWRWPARSSACAT